MNDSKEEFLMKSKTKTVFSTDKMVLCALLTALVAVLQIMGAAIRLGPFSVSLVLVPVVIGAAMCGIGAGAWLGFVFGAAVLITDAGAFLSVSVIGTVLTVLLKGMLCGLCAGAAYRLLEKHSRYAAVACAAIVCPLVNTGVFLIGCFIFFMDTLREWAGGGDVMNYIIFVLVGGNFLFEILSNVILSPVIVRLLNIGKKIS